MIAGIFGMGDQALEDIPCALLAAGAVTPTAR